MSATEMDWYQRNVMQELGWRVEAEVAARPGDDAWEEHDMPAKPKHEEIFPLDPAQKHLLLDLRPDEGVDDQLDKLTLD